METLTQDQITKLQEQNKQLQADNDCLYNYFDRARSLQCSLRHFLESVQSNGVTKAWEYLGLRVHGDYAALTDMLGCYPAFNVSRDQLKDTLESQVNYSSDLKRKLDTMTRMAEELAEDIELEGMKSDTLTRFNLLVDKR